MGLHHVSPWDRAVHPPIIKHNSSNTYSYLSFRICHFRPSIVFFFQPIFYCLYVWIVYFSISSDTFCVLSCLLLFILSKNCLFNLSLYFKRSAYSISSSSSKERFTSFFFKFLFSIFLFFILFKAAFSNLFILICHL
jgi:hypothetical protein